MPLTFTALKTAVPAPDEAYGLPLERGRPARQVPAAAFEPVTFVVHLMQGGRLLVDAKQSAKPRGGQARFVFDGDGPALLLTEQGTERRAGVWCVDRGDGSTSPPLDRLGPEARPIEPDELAGPFADASRCACTGSSATSTRSPGIGRRLANEVCHRAKLSPFAMTGKLGPDGATAVVDGDPRGRRRGARVRAARDDMSSSKDRPGRVHGRTGEPCPVCGDTIRAVEYSGYTVSYCPTCQTGGKVLADNTTSKFLK